MGDYTSREPEREAYVNKKRGPAEKARQQRVNELEGAEENSVNLESAKPMTKARRKALERQQPRREKKGQPKAPDGQGNGGPSM